MNDLMRYFKPVVCMLAYLSSVDGPVYMYVRDLPVGCLGWCPSHEIVFPWAGMKCPVQI